MRRSQCRPTLYVRSISQRWDLYDLGSITDDRDPITADLASTELRSHLTNNNRDVHAELQTTVAKCRSNHMA